MAATSVKNQLGEALLQGLWSVGGGDIGSDWLSTNENILVNDRLIELTLTS